jgi:hypothetical protein
MKYFPLFVLLALCCSAAPALAQSAERDSLRLPNGLYLVLAQHPGPGAAPAHGGQMISFHPDFLEEDEKGEPPVLEVAAGDYVPLLLAVPPESVAQTEQRRMLLISLEPQAAERLADFTERYLDRSAAIVVGGQALAMHRIRARIEGGKLQITRCTDRACEYVYYELGGN